MEQETFIQHFRAAHQNVLEFTRTIVMQELPDDVRFLIYPNQSYDGNPLVDDEVVFPEDNIGHNGYLGPWTEAQVVEWAWREGKVPEWINISVEAQDSQFTYISLLCCGRFTAMEQNLYHCREGYPPFHVLSPAVPHGWESLEESGKFDLYWERQRKQGRS